MTLGSLKIWGDRNVIYSHSQIIIDVIKSKVPVSNALQMHGETYSLLIGVDPKGGVMFTSQGSINDKEVHNFTE